MGQTEEGARRVALRLQEAGHVAYLAGGCVRDRLLGRVPKDYDIATSARPEEVKALFRGAQGVGAHFGVVLVREGGVSYDVATFREDGRYLDGRHPESVRYAGVEEDARRRDFTINGLYFDPRGEDVIDLVGGREDLEAGVIRCIGEAEERFAEDKLRLMRAVRFAAQLGFRIEEGSLAAVGALAGELGGVSVERVRDEFVKILEGPGRVVGFDLLVETGLMGVIVPEVYALQGCEQPPQYHPEGDVFVHTRLMLSLLEGEQPLELVLAVLLHDIAKPATRTVDETGRARFNGHDRIGAEMAEEILRRLKFSNRTVGAVVEMVGRHMQFMNVQQMRESKLKRFMAGEQFPLELALHRVDCLGSHGMLDNLDYLDEKGREFASEPVMPPPLVTGRDLVALGWSPGPEFRPVLDEAMDLQLEGVLRDRAAALAWLAGRVGGGH
jgi:poly(A) polymerase